MKKDIPDGLYNVQSSSNTYRVMKPINVRWAKYVSRWADEYKFLAFVRPEKRNVFLNHIFATVSTKMYVIETGVQLRT